GLFFARAAVLEDLGRTDEASDWSRRGQIAADAIAAKRAESDTVEIHEVEFDAPAGYETPADSNPDDVAAQSDADDATTQPETHEPGAAPAEVASTATDSSAAPEDPAADKNDGERAQDVADDPA